MDLILKNSMWLSLHLPVLQLFHLRYFIHSLIPGVMEARLSPLQSMSSHTHRHKGVNQRVGGCRQRHAFVTVVFGSYLSHRRPSRLPLISPPILPLQWTCVAFGAAGSRWRWHHLHCSTLQHWVWTKTCQPNSNDLVAPSLRLSVSLPRISPRRPSVSPHLSLTPSLNKALSASSPFHMLEGEGRLQRRKQRDRCCRDQRQDLPCCHRELLFSGRWHFLCAVRAVAWPHSQRRTGGLAVTALHRDMHCNAQMSEGHAVMAPYSEPLGPYQQDQLPQESTEYTKAEATRFMDSVFSTVCLSLSFFSGIPSPSPPLHQ